jgi:outer membrane protein assembly factor BamA
MLLNCCLNFLFFIFPLGGQNNSYTADSLAPALSPIKHTYRVERISIEGNKVTKRSIVLRELLVKEGDTLYRTPLELSNLLLTCRNNLANTSLFTVAFVTYETLHDSVIEVKVKVGERLYTWPNPIFELADRNFNAWWQTKNFARTNYGFYIIRYNFRGRNETLSLNLQWGFTKNVSLSYSVPYISKKKSLGMGFNAKFSENNEIFLKTDLNKIVFYKNREQAIRKVFQVGLRFSYRKGIYTTHRLGLTYNTVWVADTVVKRNPEYLGNASTQKDFINLEYQFDLDYRNVRAYPLKGYYFGYVIGTYQSGIQSDFNTTYIVSAYNKYIQLADRFYAAAGVKAKFSSPGTQAYFNQRALGYGNDLVRGYAYYVVDGQHYGLLKSTLKYELIRPHIVKVKYIPFEKFNTVPMALYINIFADGGYVRDNYTFKNNPINNTILTGYGIGLDYVTYYDVVFRMEYSINKFGQGGVFLNFNATL